MLCVQKGEMQMPIFSKKNVILLINPNISF